MELEKIKDYQIRIIKREDSKDATKPNDIKDVEGFKPGRQFFQIQLLAQRIGAKLQQVRSITENIFNSNDQIVFFNAIQDALSEEKNYTKAVNGDIIIHPSVLLIGGCQVEVKLPFTYNVFTTVNGSEKPFMTTVRDGKGGYTEKQATRSILRFFCYEHEEIDVRTAVESMKVERWKITPNNDTEDNPV